MAWDAAAELDFIFADDVIAGDQIVFTRAGKIIGASVYNDQKEKIGSIDDLIIKNNNQIVMAIVSVGGFLGINNKLVAIPYEQVHVDLGNKDTPVLLAGANKDTLSAMPTFTFNP